MSVAGKHFRLLALVAISAIIIACPPSGLLTALQQQEKIHNGAQANYWVDAINGSDSNPGSQSQPFKTITKAVTTAGTNQIIQVLPGTYNAALGESFPITLKSGQSLVGDVPNNGNGPSPTLVVGHATVTGGSFTYATFVGASSSSISGLMFNDSAYTVSMASIVAVNSQMTVTNNTFSSNVYAGVELCGTGPSSVGQNVFNTASYGVYLGETTDALQISSNVFNTSSIPIDMEGLASASSPVISSNLIIGSGQVGIQCTSGSALVTGNTFENSTGYEYGACYAVGTPKLRSNTFQCAYAVVVSTGNPDCGTSSSLGNNNFSAVTVNAIDLKPSSSAAVSAYGNSWAHNPPTTGSSGTWDILVESGSTGTVTWATGDTYP